MSEKKQTTALVESKESTNTMSLADIEKVSGYLMNSIMKPAHFKTKNDAVIAAITGRDLGMGVTQSWNGLYVIKGKVGLNYTTMLALIKRDIKGFRHKIIERSEKKASIKIWNNYKEEPDWFDIVEYTVEDAMKTPEYKSNPNYRHRLKNQLMARCISTMARTYYPEVIQGLYTPEEIMYFDDLNDKPESKPISAVLEIPKEEVDSMSKLEKDLYERKKAYALAKKDNPELTLNQFLKDFNNKDNVKIPKENVVIDVIPEPICKDDDSQLVLYQKFVNMGYTKSVDHFITKIIPTIDLSIKGDFGDKGLPKSVSFEQYALDWANIKKMNEI